MYEILLIEDDELVSSYISESLSNSPFRVKAVETTGSGALKAVSSVDPDLILADIVLDGSMDGVEAVEKIKKFHTCPVVFLTSHSDKDTIERAKKINPLGYILKPFRPEELVYTINIAMNRFNEYKSEPDYRFKSKRFMFNDKINGLITTNKSGVITSINSVAEKITRKYKKDVFGYNLENVLNATAENPEYQGTKLHQLIQDSDFKAFEGVCYLIDKNGRFNRIAVFAYQNNSSWAKTGNVVILFDLLERISENPGTVKDIRLLLHASNYIKYAVVSLIGNRNGIEILESSYTDNKEFVKNAKNDLPDVVIVDYGMYESISDFIWDIRSLAKKLGKETGIITYFHYIDSENIYKVLRAGVSGIIHSESGLSELLPAIKSAHKRKIWIDKMLIREICGNWQPERVAEKASVDKLTERESHIYNLVVNGMSNKKIAEDLSISINTVKNTLTSIYSKLEVNGRKDLFSSFAKKTDLFE